MNVPSPHEHSRKSAEERRRGRELAEPALTIQTTWTVRTVSLFGLLVLATAYTLHFAKVLFLPIVLATLLSVLLSPLVRSLTKWLPRSVATGFVLFAFLLTVASAGWVVKDPAQEWFGELPERLEQVEYKTRTWVNPMDEVRMAAEKVGSITGNGDDGEQPVAEQPSVTSLLVRTTRELLGSLAVLVGLLYFLLASGDMFLRKLVRVLPTMEDKRRAVSISRRIGTDVSSYLLTITLINACLGIALALALAALGVESPQFWGALAALLNFVPYLGAAVGIGLLTLSSILAADTPTWTAVIPPLTYLLLTTLEATFVTPWGLGQRLSLNPVAVFLGLLFWGFLWGIPGVIIAVPLLVTFKLVCDGIEGLRGISVFLGD